MPTQWSISALPQSQPPAVLVEIYTPQGATVLFLPAEGAATVGEQLVEAARLARTNLVTPPGATGKSRLILP